jgi:hypothetical protein
MISAGVFRFAVTGAALLLSALAPFSVANAQTCHSLEGSWVLKPEGGMVGAALSFDPYYAISAIRLTMRLRGPTVEQDWEFSGAHLQRATRYEFTTDGQRQASGIQAPTDFEYAAVSSVWQNCTLIQTGYSRLFGMEVSTVSSYVISPEGKELTILQSGESPIAAIERRLEFRKDEP